jgi:hypothetical protein
MLEVFQFTDLGIWGFRNEFLSRNEQVNDWAFRTCGFCQKVEEQQLPVLLEPWPTL